jgi:hypothetical protein
MMEKDRFLNILHKRVNFSSLQHKINHSDFDIFQYICSVFAFYAEIPSLPGLIAG